MAGLKKIVLDPKADPTGFHLTQIQDNVDQSLRDISNFPLLKGVFVSQFLSPVGQQTINHGLGRPYVGWFVVDKDTDSNIWSPDSVNPFKDKQIFLRASVSVNVKLYIF